MSRNIRHSINIVLVACFFIFTGRGIYVVIGKRLARDAELSRLREENHQLKSMLLGLEEYQRTNEWRKQ